MRQIEQRSPQVLLAAGRGLWYNETARCCTYGGGAASSSVKLWLKRGVFFHKINVDRDQGTAPLPGLKTNTYATFSVSYGDYANYTPQSMHYENVDGGTIYLPMWGYNPKATPNPGKANENVILVYRNINNETRRDIPYDEVWTIKKGTNTNVVLEMEACGFPQGRSNPSENNVFWFNANQGTVNSAGNIIWTNGGIYTNSQNIK